MSSSNLFNLTPDTPNEPDPLLDSDAVLSSTFKTAASTLTQLLLTSKRQTRSAYESGYRQALQDVLDQLQQGQQVESWVRDKLGDKKDGRSMSNLLDVTRLSSSLPGRIGQRQAFSPIISEADSLKRRHDEEQIFDMESPPEGSFTYFGETVIDVRAPPPKKLKEDSD